MINYIIYILLISEFLIRYNLSKERSVRSWNILLISVIIQSLMIYPSISSPIVEIREKGLDQFKTPFSTEINLLFPTVVSVALFFVCKTKFKWRFDEIKFPFYAIFASIVFSYVTPYNKFYNATNLVVVLFLQIGLLLYIVKTYVNSEQLFIGLYDGLKIIVIVELLISLSYSILGIDILQSFFIYDLKEADWVREGTIIRRAYGTSMHPNRLAGLCAFIFVFFISSFFNCYKKRSSILWATCAFLVIILSQSRSALTAAVFTYTVLYILRLYKNGRLSLRRLIVFFIVGSFLLICLFSFSIVNDMFFKSDADNMEDARLDHYLAGWLLLNDTNFLGVGLNAHVHYMYYSMDIEGIVGKWMATHAIHSIHLIIWVETGLAGFAIWLYFLYSRFRRYIKTPISEMNNPVLWMAFVGMLSIVILHGFTDPVYLQYQYLLIIMLIGSFYKKKNLPKLISKH